MRAVKKAGAILDDICEALLQGRYDALTERTERVEALLSGIAPDSISEPLLSDIKEKLNRNERLTEAAREGLRHAARDMDEYLQRCGDIGTYSSAGQRVNLSGDPGGPVRRA